MNFLPARMGDDGRSIDLPGGVDVPVPEHRVAECVRHIGRDVVFGLRPEHMFAGHADAPDVFVVPGHVQLVEPLGSDTLGLVRLGGGDDGGEITGRFPPDAGLKLGQNLPVGLAMSHFHLFDPKDRRRDPRRRLVTRPQGDPMRDLESPAHRRARDGVRG